MKRGTEIPRLRKLIVALEIAARKNKAPIWAAVASKLSTPTRKRAAVNINKLDRLAKAGSVMLVPGKVLSLGDAPANKFTVAAYSFSKPALLKLQGAGCKTVQIEALIKENPKGSNIAIVV